MSWSCIAKISNQTGEYNFAVIPVTGYTGPSGSSTTQFQIYGQRQSNSESGTNPAYYDALSVLTDLEAQGLENKFEKTAAWTDFIYSSVGGRGLSMGASSVTAASTYHQYSIFARHYTNFQQYTNIGSASPSIFSDANTTNPGLYWILLVNEEEEKIYCGILSVGRYYERADHSPRYYDSVTIQAFIFDSGAAANLWETFKDDIPTPGPEPGAGGPYDDGGTSTGTDTGTGDFDETSDPVALPTLPSVSALSSGLISLYKVSQTEVSKFVGFLWSDSFSVASLSKIFSDPMQAIISFGMFPFDVSAGASVPIYLGKNDTGAVGDLVTAQYVTVPMGSVNLTEFYGGALDYNPYTKIQLVLPYCGVVNINPDEFMTKAVTVTYRVDILSGACVAFVSDGERVLQQVNGNCLVTLPYASTDFKQVYSSLLGLAGTAGAAIVAGATGGLTAPVVGGIGASLAMNTLNAKENYARGGAAGSTLGFLGVQTPYLVITRPRQCLPENNGHFQGYPLYTTERLGDLTGYTKVAQIHLDDIDATDSELKEIDRLLKEGVIL